MHTVEYVGGPLDGEFQDHDRLTMELTIGIETPMGYGYCDYELHFRDGLPTFVAEGVDPYGRDRPTLSPCRSVPIPRPISMEFVGGGVSQEYA